MGTVFLATREDGQVSLDAAVKAITAPLWSPLMASRFQKERQILAELRHPNIAAFLDGGVNEQGLPYLVMEYIDGLPIDRYCDDRRLSLRQRLELFVAVCSAVSFAHRVLVVHRDLKPSNILVNAAGEPKVIDFGIARTIAEPAGEGRKQTTGLFATPLYSCPEVLRGEPPSVSDDVYSLGVLLYELLSGNQPFGTPQSTPAELIGAVLNAEPRELQTGDGPETGRIAAARGESPASLRLRLRGELSGIVSKVLAKTAVERYDSVDRLAEDIGRYLSGHPVLAASGGAVYRARKFVTRHRVGVAAGFFIVIALTAALAATLWEARIARIERAASERRFSEARELIRYMMYDLPKSIEVLAGSTPIKADLVRRSVGYLDRLSSERLNDSGLKTDLGWGYAEMADVLGSPQRPNLGDVKQAMELYRKAISLFEPIQLKDPTNIRAWRGLARAQLMLGLSLNSQRKWEEAKKLVESSVRESESLSRKAPGDFHVQRQAASAYYAFGMAIPQVRSSPEAAEALEKSLEHAEAAVAVQAGDVESQVQLAQTLAGLGQSRMKTDGNAAETFFGRAITVLDGLPADRRLSLPTRSTRANVLEARGWNLGTMGEYVRGISWLEGARDEMERLTREDPKNRFYAQALAQFYRNLGVIHGYAGQVAGQLDSDLQAIRVYDGMLAGQPENPGNRMARALLQLDASSVAWTLHHGEQALQLAQSGLGYLKPATMRPEATGDELDRTGLFLVQTGIPQVRDVKLGLALAKRARQATGGKDYVILETLAAAYWEDGDREGAILAMEDALQLIPAPQKGEAPSRVRAKFEGLLAHYRSDKPHSK